MIFLVVFIIILYVTIYSKKKYKNSTKDITTNKYYSKNNGTKVIGNKTDVRPNAADARKKVMDQIEKGLRDDRNGDWLARQLMDERRSLVMVNIMFQLKGNKENANAKMLKEMHERNCDANGIDRAVT